MSNECSHGSCKHGHHEHSHAHSHHCSHESCCGCCSSCCCHGEGEHKQGHKYAEELLHLADEAWMEVVKERIKEEIVQKAGKHINQLAKLVGEANHERWKQIILQKKNCEEFEVELRALICQQHSKTGK